MAQPGLGSQEMERVKWESISLMEEGIWAVREKVKAMGGHQKR